MNLTYNQGLLLGFLKDGTEHEMSFACREMDASWEEGFALGAAKLIDVRPDEPSQRIFIKITDAGKIAQALFAAQMAAQQP